MTPVTAIVVGFACEFLELADGNLKLAHRKRSRHRHFVYRRLLVPIPRSALEFAPTHHHHPWATPTLAVPERLAEVEILPCQRGTPIVARLWSVDEHRLVLAQIHVLVRIISSFRILYLDVEHALLVPKVVRGYHTRLPG